MAYMNAERKAARADKIRAICKKYGVKGSLSVLNHSTLVLTVSSGKIDFFESYNRICSESVCNEVGSIYPAENSLQVNEYWYKQHFDGKALDFLNEVVPALYGDDYYDHSDIQTDYFNCSHFIRVNIGRWNKPYQLTA